MSSSSQNTVAQTRLLRHNSHKLVSDGKILYLRECQGTYRPLQNNNFLVGLTNDNVNAKVQARSVLQFVCLQPSCLLLKWRD